MTKNSKVTTRLDRLACLAKIVTVAGRVTVPEKFEGAELARLADVAKWSVWPEGTELPN